MNKNYFNLSQLLKEHCNFNSLIFNSLLSGSGGETKPWDFEMVAMEYQRVRKIIL